MEQVLAVSVDAHDRPPAEPPRPPGLVRRHDLVGHVADENRTDPVGRVRARVALGTESQASRTFLEAERDERRRERARHRRFAVDFLEPEALDASRPHLLDQRTESWLDP